MFSNKFNPDVINIYETNLYNRNNSKYELKNIPYKLILKDDIKKINNVNDLVINSDNDIKNLDEKYKLILNERNIKNKLEKKIIKEKLELKHIDLNEEYIDDFNDIKKNFKSEFKDKEFEIKKDRDKFNSILDSLLADGLLD